MNNRFLTFIAIIIFVTFSHQLDAAQKSNVKGTQLKKEANKQIDPQLKDYSDATREYREKGLTPDQIKIQRNKEKLISHMYSVPLVLEEEREKKWPISSYERCSPPIFEHEKPTLENARKALKNNDKRLASRLIREKLATLENLSLAVNNEENDLAKLITYWGDFNFNLTDGKAPALTSLRNLYEAIRNEDEKLATFIIFKHPEFIKELDKKVLEENQVELFTLANLSKALKNKREALENRKNLREELRGGLLAWKYEDLAKKNDTLIKNLIQQNPQLISLENLRIAIKDKDKDLEALLVNRNPRFKEVIRMENEEEKKETEEINPTLANLRKAILDENNDLIQSLFRKNPNLASLENLKMAVKDKDEDLANWITYIKPELATQIPE